MRLAFLMVDVVWYFFNCIETRTKVEWVKYFNDDNNMLITATFEYSKTQDCLALLPTNDESWNLNVKSHKSWKKRRTSSKLLCRMSHVLSFYCVFILYTPRRNVNKLLIFISSSYFILFMIDLKWIISNWWKKEYQLVVGSLMDEKKFNFKR